VDDPGRRTEVAHADAHGGGPQVPGGRAGGSGPIEPLIVDVKRNALDDGPGIRSVVFFKGCPLRCVWCQNPEALSPLPELQRDPAKCAACGDCARACPAGVARPATEPQDRAACRLCGACIDACPVAGRRICGTRHDAGALAESLLRDEAFYRASGGGVTFSGGEPALHPEFAGRVASRLAERGIHVLLETSGDFEWGRFAKSLLPFVRSVYVDVKLADPEAHRAHTGRGNARILENLDRLLAERRVYVLPRVPLVPGITDGPDNLAAIAGLLLRRGVRRVALLPYNPLWVPKRRALGLDLPYARTTWMSRDEIVRCGDVVRKAGLEVLE
jgi:pyruvate formate lyase activating enzyme